MARLTPAGTIVERLRGERELTQEELARAIGVTRQHYSRVIKGQADLKLREWRQLADTLGVDLGTILQDTGGQWEPDPAGEGEEAPSETELGEFVSNMDRIVRTLRTLPGGALGKPIKVAVLNAAEQSAAETGATLPLEYYDIRRKVLAGEL